MCISPKFANISTFRVCIGYVLNLASYLLILAIANISTDIIKINRACTSPQRGFVISESISIHIRMYLSVYCVL
jgi:hypothetical protein